MFTATRLYTGYIDNQSVKFDKFYFGGMTFYKSILRLSPSQSNPNSDEYFRFLVCSWKDEDINFCKRAYHLECTAHSVS